MGSGASGRLRRPTTDVPDGFGHWAGRAASGPTPTSAGGGLDSYAGSTNLSGINSGLTALLQELLGAFLTDARDYDYVEYTIYRA